MYALGEGGASLLCSREAAELGGCWREGWGGQHGGAQLVLLADHTDTVVAFCLHTFQ